MATGTIVEAGRRAKLTRLDWVKAGIEAALLTGAASMHAEAGIVTVNTIVVSYCSRADR